MSEKHDDIVPDGFDLTEAKKKQSSTPREEMEGCPECGSVVIRYRVNDDYNVPINKQNPEDECYCEHCGATFDEDETVEPHSVNETRS